MGVFDEVRQLLVGIAWPVTALLVAFFLRREIRTAVAALRDRISAADTGELVAGPVSVRWSGAIAAASTAILQLPVEADSESAVELRGGPTAQALTASVTPVKSVIDAYESVFASLLALPPPVPDQPELLVGADAGTLAQPRSTV